LDAINPFETESEVGQTDFVQVRPIPLFSRRKFIVNNRLCFVLMPFAEAFRGLYDGVIKTAVESVDLECLRADDIGRSGVIVSQIWESLMEARVVIADLTGANGNVLYELGIAHVIGHPAILLTQRIEDVPYDLRQERHFIYDLSELGRDLLRTRLKDALESMLA
ncbi:MAG: hypothetical protein ACRDHE_18070, partial [Ktedonobacterales bacterium]